MARRRAGGPLRASSPTLRTGRAPSRRARSRAGCSAGRPRPASAPDAHSPGPGCCCQLGCARPPFGWATPWSTGLPSRPPSPATPPVRPAPGVPRPLAGERDQFVIAPAGSVRRGTARTPAQPPARTEGHDTWSTSTRPHQAPRRQPSPEPAAPAASRPGRSGARRARDLGDRHRGVDPHLAPGQQGPGHHVGGRAGQTPVRIPGEHVALVVTVVSESDVVGRRRHHTRRRLREFRRRDGADRRTRS